MTVTAPDSYSEHDPKRCLALTVLARAMDDLYGIVRYRSKRHFSIWQGSPSMVVAQDALAFFRSGACEDACDYLDLDVEAVRASVRDNLAAIRADAEQQLEEATEKQKKMEANLLQATVEVRRLDRKLQAAEHRRVKAERQAAEMRFQVLSRLAAVQRATDAEKLFDTPWTDDDRIAYERMSADLLAEGDG